MRELAYLECYLPMTDVVWPIGHAVGIAVEPTPPLQYEPIGHATHKIDPS
jgi:hypothetical protein